MPYEINFKNFKKMKKQIIAGLLGLSLLLPLQIGAAENSTLNKSEFSAPQQKKKKSKKRKSTVKRTASKSCTYNGHALMVGSRGGCYYYSGNSKEYVDRSYCSGCN